MHHAAPTRPLVLLVSFTHTALAGHLGICNLSSEHTLKRVNLERGCFMPNDNATLVFCFPALSRPHTTLCSVGSTLKQHGFGRITSHGSQCHPMIR
ncbi:hypothetical protein CCUS01_01636 [Colletotrichum cuscutae]|uniref:Secreted protein n=1 Tax=Colletotrichum cuscutae TaxID=1209917 RepID=A0AAI9XNY8_9PEZI|nr:hypothetical protein CCUS01_01636 [Colletotrichum cuscutae]